MFLLNRRPFKVACLNTLGGSTSFLPSTAWHARKAVIMLHGGASAEPLGRSVALWRLLTMLVQRACMTAHAPACFSFCISQRCG